MKRKVIGIDDDPAMIQLIRVILEKEDFEVVGATRGEEGLELIEREQPDLVLLDLMMPGMNGWEVYQHMKANDRMKDIPVIVVTARAQKLDKELGLHVARVQDYITIPFTPDQLLDSIRTVFGDEQ